MRISMKFLQRKINFAEIGSELFRWKEEAGSGKLCLLCLNLNIEFSE
jgi:hypothetical protein